MAEFVIADIVAEPSISQCVEREFESLLPVEDDRLAANVSMPAIVEMLLKDTARLNRLLRVERYQRELIPGLLAVAIAGLAIHGVAMTAIINALFAKYGFWMPHLPASSWNDLSAANLTFSYTVGAVAANGICLPSFYFYGLLAGVRISFLGAAAHALKGLAAGSVALVGLLPIYVALALSAIVFPFDATWARYVLIVGLVALPCVAGLTGMANLYEGFVGLADTMAANRCASRRCFLKRLTWAWVTCSTVVAPVVIYSLWHLLAGWTQS